MKELEAKTGKKVVSPSNSVLNLKVNNKTREGK